MEQVIMNLALEYAKSRGLNKITDKALEYAYEALGIEEEKEEEYTGGGIYGMKNAFSPKNLINKLGRNVLSSAAKKSISGGGSGSSFFAKGLPLIGGALALGYMTNPLREGSYNYNPELQGQIDYASGRGYIGINPGSGLAQYLPNSVLSGQNVISGFGTNDYGKQLQKNLKRLEGYKNPNDKTREMIEKTKTEIEDLTTAEWDEVDAFMETQNNNDNGGSDPSPAPKSTHTSTISQKDSLSNIDAARARRADGGRARYGSGGIASLWQR